MPQCALRHTTIPRWTHSQNPSEIKILCPSAPIFLETLRPGPTYMGVATQWWRNHLGKLPNLVLGEGMSGKGLVSSFELWRDRRGRISTPRIIALLLLVMPIGLAIAAGFTEDRFVARPLHNPIH